MLLRTHLFIFLIFAAPVGVSADGRSNPLYVNDFYCDQGPLALRVGPSLENLRTLGRLSEERVRELKPDGTETRVLHYDGLIVRAIFPPRDHANGLVEEVTISKPQWDLASGLKVGTSLSTLSGKINRTINLKGSELTICGDTDCVTLTFKKDRVQRIKYVCYTG